MKLTGREAEIGLGLRPGLTGHGAAESFVRACLRFASAALGAQSYTLAVAAFNRRAITVYERSGFQEVECFEHVTSGGISCLYPVDQEHHRGLCMTRQASPTVPAALLRRTIRGR